MTPEEYLNGNYDQKDCVDHFIGKIRNPVIFDIGSCDGLDSVRYAKLFPSAKIYSFEPLHDNFSSIIHNIEKFAVSNIYPHNIALSSKSGMSDFYVSSGCPEDISESSWNYGNKSSSLLAPKEVSNYYKWLNFNEIRKVPTITLDDFCFDNDIDIVDFIHLDVQGAELNVLNGGLSVLRKTTAVWLEVSNLSLYEGQALRSDVEGFMKSLNFLNVLDKVGALSGDQFWVNRDVARFRIFHYRLLSLLKGAHSFKF